MHYSISVGSFLVKGSEKAQVTPKTNINLSQGYTSTIAGKHPFFQKLSKYLKKSSMVNLSKL